MENDGRDVRVGAEAGTGHRGGARCRTGHLVGRMGRVAGHRAWRGALGQVALPRAGKGKRSQSVCMDPHLDHLMP